MPCSLGFGPSPICSPRTQEQGSLLCLSAPQRRVAQPLSPTPHKVPENTVRKQRRGRASHGRNRWTCPDRALGLDSLTQLFRLLALPPAVYHHAVPSPQRHSSEIGTPRFVGVKCYVVVLHRMVSAMVVPVNEESCLNYPMHGQLIRTGPVVPKRHCHL